MDEILATVRRIISEDERKPGALLKGAYGRARAGDAAGDSGDILELTAAIDEDGSIRHLVPVGASARREPAFREPPSVALYPEAKVEPPRRANADLEPPPARSAPGDARRAADADPVAAGDRTIEDVVRALLRPLLQTWLDENLPEIVERLARAEIARVVDKSGVV